MSLSRSPPGSSRSSANAFVMARHASRSSMGGIIAQSSVTIGTRDALDQAKVGPGCQESPRTARMPFL
jgi:hypothetical protein